MEKPMIRILSVLSRLCSTMDALTESGFRLGSWAPVGGGATLRARTGTAATTSAAAEASKLR